MAKQTKAQKAQVEDAVIVEQTTLPTFVESTVKNEVQKIDVAEAAILEKVKKYKNLKVKDKDDEKGITLVKEAYQDLVKTRTSIDKKRAEIKKPFLDVGKGIDDYAKKLTALFAEVENTLKLENDKVKQWEKEAEEKNYTGGELCNSQLSARKREKPRDYLYLRKKMASLPSSKSI